MNKTDLEKIIDKFRTAEALALINCATDILKYTYDKPKLNPIDVVSKLTLSDGEKDVIAYWIKECS